VPQSDRFISVVTNADKLFLFAMEACRPDQIEALLAISRRKGRPLAEIVGGIMRDMLDDLPWEERQEVIAGFREEDGINLELL
jgi:hypothetical protein